MSLTGQLLADQSSSATGGMDLTGATSLAQQGGFKGLFGKSLINAFQQQKVGDRASNNLRADVTRMTGEREAIAPTKAKHIGQVGNAASRLRRSLGAQASSAVATQTGTPPVSYRGAIEQATRRMRARQGIASRGEAAIANQTLRDRIQVARANQSRRGAIHGALGSAAGIREGVQLANTQANQMIAESRANMFGTLAGAATSALMQYGRRPGGGISQGVDQGTAAADYMNMNPNTGYDPYTGAGELYS